jgi:hypothetical protein
MVPICSAPKSWQRSARPFFSRSTGNRRWGVPFLCHHLTHAVLATPTDAELHLVPALIADAGDAAGWCYVGV